MKRDLPDGVGVRHRMDGRFVGRHVAQEIGDGGASRVVGVALADLIVEESGVAHGGMLVRIGAVN